MATSSKQVFRNKSLLLSLGFNFSKRSVRQKNSPTPPPSDSGCAAEGMRGFQEAVR
jgi:hypothetical protein